MLSAKCNLPNSHLFRFFQIRHFVQKQSPHIPHRPPEAEIDQFITLSPNQKRVVSVIFNRISSLNPSITASFKTSWEQDIGVVMSKESWDKILHLVHSASICARHGLLQCKILFKAHYTNAILAKIFPDKNSECNRCHQAPANHLHMFWTCSQLSTFWSDIFKSLSEIFQIPINLDPLTALFGLPQNPNIPLNIKRAIAFTTLQARRSILLKWKRASPPTHNKWIQEIFSCLKLKKKQYSLKGSL